MAGNEDLRRPDVQAHLPDNEMRITGVEINEYRSGIPIQGWENLRAALNAFASGVQEKVDLQSNIK